MSPLSEEEIRKIININDGGSFEELVGPHRCDDQRIWEIWVQKDREYDTRFIIEFQGEEPVYVQNFGALCAHVEHTLKLESSALKQQVSDLLERQKVITSNNNDNKIKVYIAAFVFVSAVLVLLYLLVLNKSSSQTTILTCIVGVVASGGAYFFGAWKEPKG